MQKLSSVYLWLADALKISIKRRGSDPGGFLFSSGGCDDSQCMRLQAILGIVAMLKYIGGMVEIIGAA